MSTNAVAKTQPAGVEQLIELARDKDVNVEVLERLVAMAERQADRHAAKEFHEAMAQFQEKCPPIPHSASADFPTKSGVRMTYSYAELHQIADTIRPYLHPEGLSYSFDSKVVDGQMEATCTLFHVNGHSRTAVATGPTASNNPGTSELQKTQVARKYCCRQALIQVLGLTTCDPDTDGAEAEPITAEQAKALLKMIDETGTDTERFCKYLGVSSVPEIRAAQFSQAVTALEQKHRDNVAAKAQAKDLLTDAGGGK